MSKSETKSRSKPPYENLQAKAAKGDYSSLIDPLDFRILEVIPNEGEMAFGLYPQGESSQGIASAIDPEHLTGNQVGTRLRVMRQLGLALTVKMINSSYDGWQRTAAGTKVYEDWRKKNNR